MFTLSLVIFAIAALGGVALAVLHFRAEGREHPPTALALLHGVVAVVAVLLLLIGIGATANGFAAGFSSLAIIALLLFALAALGGAYMFFGRHLRGEPLPTPVVVIHALVAVTGFVVLLAYVVSSQTGA
jgi:hypothetical protein